MNESRQESGLDAPRLTEEVGAWLRRARGPALVIAPVEAVLLAANPSGLRLLGFESLQSAVPMDSAMPAIMDLRRAVRNGAHGRAPVTALVFWTQDGIARLPCHITLGDDGHGRPLALLEIAVEGQEATGHAACDERDDIAPPGSRKSTPSTATEDTTEDTNASGDEAQPSSRSQTGHKAQDRAEPLSDATSAGSAARLIVRKSTTKTETEAETRSTGNAAPATSKKARPTAAAAHQSKKTQRSFSPSTGAATEPALSAPLPPAPTTAEATRSDADTLKAIARQILAGRRSRPDAAPAAETQQAHTPPARPNGAATSTEHDAADAVAETVPSALPGSQPPFDIGSGASADRASTAASSARVVRRNSISPMQAPPAGAADPAEVKAPPLAGRNAHGMATHSDAGQHGTTPPDDDPSRGGAARRTLVRRMAHELKTPISAIVSAAEVMKDERLGAIGDPRYLRYAQDIHGSARHALAVIERMLGQRESQPGTYELSFTNLDINALAAGLLSGLESMADEAGLALSGELAPRVPLVVADATSVRQIILNAITNALKFTPRGGTVRVVTEMTADGHLAVSVIDSGPGMSADEIARVMADGRAAASQPQQARTGGGLGIGLPLARMLATANGAILAITTPETGGTRVTLAFPASRLIPI